MHKAFTLKNLKYDLCPCSLCSKSDNNSDEHERLFYEVRKNLLQCAAVSGCDVIFRMDGTLCLLAQLQFLAANRNDGSTLR